MTTPTRPSWIEKARSPEGLVSTSSGRAILTCRSCKRKGTRTYELVKTTRLYDYRTMPVTDTRIRIEGAERAGVLDQRRTNPVAWALSRPCPDCGSGDVKVSVVQGELVESKKCGARCMGATGPVCECACGGEQHGGGHGAW